MNFLISMTSAAHWTSYLVWKRIFLMCEPLRYACCVEEVFALEWTNLLIYFKSVQANWTLHTHIYMLRRNGYATSSFSMVQSPIMIQPKNMLGAQHHPPWNVRACYWTHTLISTESTALSFAFLSYQSFSFHFYRLKLTKRKESVCCCFIRVK